MKRFFITGTDTDCGKTYVTCRLLETITKSVAIKPVASGSSDAVVIQKYSNLSLQQINPWSFNEPIAPHIAAMREGKVLAAEAIAQYCMDFTAPGAETLLIEGAGGLMVPLNDTETWVDVLKQTKIPVIFVVGMRLGCINHAMLSAQVMKAHGIVCEGWVANLVDPDMDAVEENIQTLKTFLSFPLLFTVPFGVEPADVRFNRANARVSKWNYWEL